MFAAPPTIQAEIFARLPEDLRIHGRHTDWSRERGGGPLHSFLEGPAFDRAGNLYCNRLGEPTARIASPAGIRTTNVAYGGADRRDLYITEAEDGCILRARLPVPGRAMFSHRDA